VSDSSDGEPILGTTVLVKGTDKATSTDFYGNYSITANNDDILVFSFPGYTKQEKTVGKKDEINIILLGDSNESILIYCHLPYLTNTITTIYGINYETFGLKLNNYKGLLPLKFSFGLQYASDFKSNSDYRYYFNRGVSFSRDFYLNFKISATDINFNDNQFNSYKLEISKPLKWLQFNSKYYRFPWVSLIIGNIDFKGIANSFGYGLGLSRKLFHNFHFDTSFIHWQEFNEFNTNASYKGKRWHNWHVTARYKHLYNYEELQIGISYDINLYRK